MRFRAKVFEAAFTCALVGWSLAARAGVARPTAEKGPYLTNLSESGVTVRFELDVSASASVDVSVEASLEGGVARPLRFESAVPSAMHSVPLTGLAPSTRYAYTVRVGTALVASGHFVTGPPPDSNDPRSFLVYGDDRTDDDAHAAVVRAMSTVPSDFLVHTGDMVADGGSAVDWASFFRIERGLLRDRALFVAIGNHELYDDAAGTNFARYFGFTEGADSVDARRPYGTVRSGNVRFFFLNGMHDWAAGPEREWLERALASADAETGVVWRFAVVHHGPWSSGPHGPNPRLIEARVPELLAAHKVDLLFSGHDHIYERGDAGVLKYVVSGGGGAPLYRDLHTTPTTRKVEPAHHFLEVTTRAGKVEVVARRVDGSVLDRCGFAKNGPWDCDVPSRGSLASPTSTLAASSSMPSVSNSPDAAADPRAKACACDLPGSALDRPSRASAVLTGLVILAARRRRRAHRARRVACEPNGPRPGRRALPTHGLETDAFAARLESRCDRSSPSSRLWRSR